MFLFSDELQLLLDVVHTRRSAQVVGPWGVGTTSLMCALTDQLKNEDYAVVSVKGAPFARGIEYFALHEALPGLADGLIGRPFFALLDRTIAFLGKSRLTAIIIDSLEHVDRGTLTLLQAVQKRTGAPMIVSRSRNLRTLIDGGSPFTVFEGPRVTLHPLDFVSTVSLLRDQLGHWPDAEVASRAFAKSAGVTGLVVALAGGAKSAGLIRLTDGQWVMAAKNLRNGEADSWIEAHLALLTAAEFDALEKVALAGRHSVASLLSLDPAAVRSLGALGLLAEPAGSGAGRLIARVPAIADYFQRSGASIPGHASADGTIRTAGAGAADPAAASDGRGDLAPSVAAFRKALERDILERARAWTATPDVASAIPYLMALLDVPRTERTIREVFAKTALSSAVSATDALDLVYLYQHWVGRIASGGQAGFDYADAARLYPEWEGVIAEFTSLFVEGPPPTLELPGVKAARWEPAAGGDLIAAAYAYSYVLGGDIYSARAWAQLIPESGQLVVVRLRRFVVAILAIADRDYATALISSRKNFATARASLDHNGILLFSYTEALSLIALARGQEAWAVVSTALAYGPPGAVDGALYRALLHVGAFVNLWSGSTSVAERLLGEAERMDVVDPGLPGTQEEFSVVLRQMIDGDPISAMHTLRATAARLNATGAGFAAELALTLALMVWPEVSTVDQLQAVKKTAGASYPAPIYDVVRQSFVDLDEAADAAGRLENTPNKTFVSRMLRVRTHQEIALGNTVSPRLHTALQSLEASLPSVTPPTAAGLDAGDEPSPRSTLTAREIQISLLARTLSNADIAIRLSIGIRTVESHLHRAMKKTQSPSRQKLYEKASSLLIHPTDAKLHLHTGA